MATWTYGAECFFLKDGKPILEAEVREALNAGEAAIVEVERLRAEIARFKEDEALLVELWRSPAFCHEGHEGDDKNWSPARTAVEILKRLRAEVAALKAAVERLREYANQLQDTQRHKGIGDAIVGILDEYAPPPPPKVEWTQKNGYKGNTEWYANGVMTLWPIFEDDKVKWRCGGFLSSFDDLAEAKRAVEAKLKGQ